MKRFTGSLALLLAACFSSGVWGQLTDREPPRQPVTVRIDPTLDDAGGGREGSRDDPTLRARTGAEVSGRQKQPFHDG